MILDFFLENYSDAASFSLCPAPQVLTIGIEYLNNTPGYLGYLGYLTGLILGYFITGILIDYVRMAMPGVTCPNCAARGVEQ